MRHPVRLLLIGGMLWGSGARYSAGRAQVDAPDAAPITAWSIDNSAITLRFDAADLNALATRLDMLKRGAAIQHYAIDANAQAAHVIGRLDVLLELQSRFVRVENTGDTPAAAQTRRPQTHVSPASALADVLVQVYPRNHTSPVHYAYTGADGGYSTAPLAPGAYQIQFVSGTATQWYRAAPGQFESTVVTVTGSTTVPGVDARLGATASGTAAITGTITTSGGALLTNVGVYCQNMDTQTSVYAFATTGKFACANLTPGPYVVYAYPPAPYPTLAFYPAAGSIGGAQRITVTSGVTIPITFVLPAGGGISGRVTVGGAPKSGVSVSAIYRGADGSSATTSTSTNSAGLYSIKRRFPGPYHVSFGDGPGYAAEIYDNAATVATATTVTVASGAVTPNINADLTAGGVIKGVVTAADSGRPIPNAVIYAYTASGNSVAYFTSDADGRFVSAGLPAGEYVLLAYPGTFVAGYGAEYYNNATTLAGATRIAVGAPGSEAIANIALDGGGSISGKTIDAATGLPVGGVYVQAALSGTALYASSTSDAFGNYRVSGLRAGSYLVYYSREPFTAMYYDRKLNIEQTQPIPVTSGDVPGKTLFLVRIKLAYLPVIRR